MSEPVSGFQRWAQLMDRAARDEALTPDEEAFCQRFARDNEAAQLELGAYGELANLESQQPDAETRALVDRALRRMDAEDAEAAVAEVRLLRPHRVPMWLAASLAGAAIVALGVFGRSQLGGEPQARAALPKVEAARPLTRAELVYTSGKVQVEGQSATAGRILLSEGTRIETGDGIACVLVDSDINLCLAPFSNMRLTALHPPARVVELGDGALATRLPTQPDGQSLTIAAGDVRSTAIGTAFSVERRKGEPVVTTVLNGKVRVASGAAERVVNAHERARSAADDVKVNSLSRSEEASSWALLGPTVLWHDPVSATLELNGEPQGAEAVLDGQLIGRAPLSSLVPVGSHRLVVRHADVILLDQRFFWNAGEAHSVKFQAPAPPEKEEPRRRKVAKVAKKDRHEVAAKVESGEPPSSTTGMSSPPPVFTGPSPADLLRSARRLVREGQLRAAVETYHNLRRTYPDSQEAHTVLVSLGQLQLSALHNPKEAVKVLDTYLERGGTLSEEARLTRIHALRALRRDKDEAAAISEFLTKHPRSFEDSTLRARLADLRTSE